MRGSRGISARVGATICFYLLGCDPAATPGADSGLVSDGAGLDAPSPSGDAGGDDATRDASASLDAHDPCAAAAEGSPCGTGLVCIAGACEASACGDGVTDTRTEACDDGNDVSGDGCEPTCTASCTTSSTCDDGEACNGVETCGPAMACVPGDELVNGTSCAHASGAGVCIGGACTAAGCGNGLLEPGEACDDGNTDELDGCRADCTFGCVTDADCRLATASVCDGDETCTPEHVCVAGAPLDCDDGNACTADSCDAVTGCGSAPMDADADGYACGVDCDDGNADIHPDHAETCDGVDENCVAGTSDEIRTTFFADCDSDGFVAAGALTAVACTAPPTAPCGVWRTSSPAVDCNDASATTFPGATEIVGDEIDQSCDGRELCYRNTDGDAARTSMTITSSDLDCEDPGEARSSTPAGDCCDTDARTFPGATMFYSMPRTTCGGYDFDCDGVESRELPGTGSCDAACAPIAGWLSAVPACGAGGTALFSCAVFGTTCMPFGATSVQRCR